LLAKGVTITMGSVDEPYLSGTPDVAVFTARLVFNRFSFGEAAYASQSVLSWQTTVVGDPLYRPFGTDPETLHQALEQRHSKFLEWSHLRLANLNLASGKPPSQWVEYLETLELTRQSAILSEKLGDLYAGLGKPASAIHAYEQALKLNPSAEQRIRLRLTLGEKLASLNREQEAYDGFRQLLKEAPAYPGKAAIESQLSALAGKLPKTSNP
jgi:tetratricopeptide (TPR) repeat protein